MEGGLLRFFAGVMSALLLVGAGFFLLQSRAEREDPIPPAPQPVPYAGALLKPQTQKRLDPPAASEKTKEQKRFARADKDDDGRITRAELLEPRRKAFAKLDKDTNGTLSFEEWAVKTGDKFEGADGDGSGWLSAAEYESTKPKTRPRKKCAC